MLRTVEDGGERLLISFRHAIKRVVHARHDSGRFGSIPRSQPRITNAAEYQQTKFGLSKSERAFGCLQNDRIVCVHSWIVPSLPMQGRLRSCLIEMRRASCVAAIWLRFPTSLPVFRHADSSLPIHRLSFYDTPSYGARHGGAHDIAADEPAAGGDQAGDLQRGFRIGPSSSAPSSRP